MEQRQYFQCQGCGSIHYTTDPYDIDKEMYEILWCQKCSRENIHLWIGNEPEDKYLYGDSYLDERYFIY